MRPFSLYIPDADVEMSVTLDDLLVYKSRTLVIVTAAFFILSAVLLSGTASTLMMGRLLGLSLAFGMLSFAAYTLMERRYLIAHLLWQAGLTGLIGITSLLFGRAEILLLAAFLPLIAAITLGGWSSLAAEAVIVGLVVWMRADPGLFPLLPIYPVMILVFGAFGGLLGWISTGQLMGTVQWALFNFNQARTRLEEAREQSLELAQTQEDLTGANLELARLADRLKILQRVAEEARQAKTEFVANVSHELRTPLNMIIGFTEIIARSPHLYGSHLPAALMTDITAIQRSSQHLSSAGQRRARPEPGGSRAHGPEPRMDLARRDDPVGPLGCRRLIPLQRAVPEIGAARSPASGLLRPDPHPPGGHQPAQQRRALYDPGRRGHCMPGEMSRLLVFSVTDTGPGIPEEDQKRIFEPFQQVDNSIRRLYGGSGLGLTISKQFIELHGGKMWLESRPGQGTAFFFTLPLAPSLDEEEAARGDRNSAAGQRVRRGLIPDDELGYRLRTRPSKAPAPRLIPRLVVLEKEQSLQRLLTRYLQDTEIVSTRSLEEAAEALSRSPAQALVANLPPFENLSSEMISIAPFGTPVITCWIPGEVEAANHLGVIQYLVKPLTRERLLSVLAGLPGEIKNVLVADDEPDELHLFARMLEFDPQRLPRAAGHQRQTRPGYAAQPQARHPPVGPDDAGHERLPGAGGETKGPDHPRHPRNRHLIPRPAGRGDYREHHPGQPRRRIFHQPPA